MTRTHTCTHTHTHTHRSEILRGFDVHTHQGLDGLAWATTLALV